MKTLALLTLVHLLPAAGALPSSDADGRVLGTVPGDAFALAHSTDLAGLQQRALLNEWVELQGARIPDPVLGDLEWMFRHGMDIDPATVWGVASKLRGETALAFTPSILSLFTADPDAAARAAFDEVLARTGRAAKRSSYELGSASVELAAWPAGWGPKSWLGRNLHFAVVDHPAALGLVIAGQDSDLRAGVEGAILGLESDRRAPLVERFLSARSSAPWRGGVEVFVDGEEIASAFAEDLAGLLDVGEEPVRSMLGLGGESWLHASIDLFPGRRVECRGTLNLPEGSLAARLADTFSGLPSDLAPRLPSDLMGLWSLQWNAGDFYRELLAGVSDSLGEEPAGRMEAGWAMARAMTGVDPVEDLLAEMEGTFAAFVREADGASGLDGLGFLVGVREGLGFQEALEALLEAPLAANFELDEIEGVEVYSAGGARSDGTRWGGLAFPPGEFVGSLVRSTLDRHLRALRGDLEASAAQGRVGQILTDERGCHFVLAAELGWLRRSRYWSPFGGGSRKRSGVSSSRLDSAWMISTAERTRTGVDFQFEVR